MEAISPILSLDDSAKHEHVGTIAAAWIRASRKQDGLDDDAIMLNNLDLHAPECWISLELYLLTLAKLMRLVAEAWRERANMGLLEAMKHLEQRGDLDVVTFHMLYLVQE
jgi:hypothetical protein